MAPPHDDRSESGTRDPAAGAPERTPSGPPPEPAERSGSALDEREERVHAALTEFLLSIEAEVAEGRDGADFEAFCDRYPDLAEDLRRLYLEWQRVAGVFERLRSARSFRGQLRERYGEGIDPGISLEHDSTTVSHGSSERLLERIAATPGDSSSRYVLRGEIARGGMGVIQKVWDEDLRRALARKVMLPKARSSEDDESGDPNAARVSRFLEEAQITGQLDHPGILPVHEMGIDEGGRPFFTMPLVKGRDFKEILELVRKGEDGWTRPRALGVILKVCEAMAFAHTKGVIHRDIKPANVMVGRFGETYVMDWGLAKVLGREETHDMRLRIDAASTFSVVETDRKDEKESDPDSPIITMDGDVVGTPAYMAPEQAQGRTEEVGPQSDVYAVGSLLYHLLTGQMPYVPLGERVSPHTVLNAVRNGPPWRILDIEKNVPEELVAICEKAMARSLDERYGDMMAMAEDLRAFLEGRVVTAYETGSIAEFRKWVVRNKAMAASLGLAFLAVIVGLVTVIQIRTRANEGLADLNEEISLKHRESMRREQEIRALKEQSDEMARIALDEKERADHNAMKVSDRAYQAALLAGDYSLRLGETVEARRALSAADESRRGWEWRHLWLRSDGSLGSKAGFPWQVPWVSFGPGEGQATALGAGGLVVCWDLETGEDVFRREEGVFTQWATLGSRRIGYYSSADLSVHVVDLEFGDRVAELEDPVLRFGVTAIALDADEERLAVVARSAGFLSNTLYVWDLGTGTLALEVGGLAASVDSVAFHPGGSLVVTADRLVRFWNTVSGEPGMVLPGPDEKIGDLAFAPDGDVLAAGYADGSIQLYDTRTGEGRGVLIGHRSTVTDVAFSGDGRRLVSGSGDRSLRVWDVGEATEIATFLGHGLAVQSVAANEDGTLFMSGSVGMDLERGAPDDDRVLLWSLDVAQPYSELLAHRDGVRDATHSADGRWIVSAGDDGRAVVWHAHSGEVQNVLRGHRAAITCVDFDRDSRRIATGSLDKTIVLWDADTGQAQNVLSGHTKAVECLTFSPDGGRVATGGRDRVMILWDAASGERLQTFPRERKRILGVTFRADGAQLVSAVDDKALSIWDVETGELVRRIPTGHTWRITSVRYTSDGRQIYTTSLDRTVKLWDVETGEEVAGLTLEESAANDLALSPDGTRLLLGTVSGEILVLDAGTREHLLTLRGHGGQVTAVGFSPDGSRVLSASSDRSLRLWETGGTLERYRALRSAAELQRRAGPFVERLFDRHLRMHRVISVLQFDRSIPLTDELRRTAIGLSRVRGDDPEAFRSSAWSLVRSADASPESRKLGLKRAQAAIELHEEVASDEPTLDLLVTRGVARYRMADFDGAREDLAAAFGSAGDDDELLPRILAFLAMSEHRLGRVADARNALEELRERRRRPSWRRDPFADDYLREAEAILETGELMGSPSDAGAPSSAPPDDGLWRLVPTADGSWTFRHEGVGQACHSLEGAWTEARERYADPCELRRRCSERAHGAVRLLDVGTGVGLNLAAAVQAVEGTGAQLDVTSLELDPGVIALTCARFGRSTTTANTAGSAGSAGTPTAGAGEAWHRPVRASLARALAASSEPTARRVPLLGRDGSPVGTLRLLLGDARAVLADEPTEPGFDAVFLDPFSPAADPDLWEPEFLAAVATRMAPGSVLSTYTVSLAVRAALAAAGLAVGIGPRVGAKRAGTLAGPDLPVRPLDARTRRRLERRVERSGGPTRP